MRAHLQVFAGGRKFQFGAVYGADRMRPRTRRIGRTHISFTDSLLSRTANTNNREQHPNKD
jgi:hypothetical protein